MRFVPKWVHISWFFISGIPVYMFHGITHMRTHTMPSLSLPYCKQWRGRQGLGTRLGFHSRVELFLHSPYPTPSGLLAISHPAQ